jgi:hypothetical protein
MDLKFVLPHFIMYGQYQLEANFLGMKLNGNGNFSHSLCKFVSEATKKIIDSKKSL